MCSPDESGDYKDCSCDEPTIVLKNTVIIKSYMGTVDDPYII